MVEMPLTLADTSFKDVALASLYVSTKEHDTLKKPRELLAVAYSVRYPELAAKSKNPNGEVDIDTMDATVRVQLSLESWTRGVNLEPLRWWKRTANAFWPLNV